MSLPSTPPVRSVGGFGGMLRDARERRGFSLRQLANATKISVAALEALERNDFSRLPGGVFSRAFVRSYAIEVGLDVDGTMQQFVEQLPNDPLARGHLTPDLVDDHQAVQSDRRAAGTFLWLALISVPIAGAVLYFATSGRRSSLRDRTLPSAASSAASLPLSARRPVERLIVGLSVTRPCQVSTSVDGRTAIERLVQPGNRETLEVGRELVLTASDASAIALTFNGTPARPLGESSDAVTVHFNLANFKSYLAAQ